MGDAPLKVALATVPGAGDVRRLAEQACAATEAADLLEVDQWDVAELVRRAGVDAGVAPRHVLAERPADLYEVLDLGAGREDLVYAAASARASGGLLRIATRHPNLTRAHFRAGSVQVTTLCLADPELAVALGLADGVVLPVTAGAARTPGGLEVAEVVISSSLRLVVGGARRATRGERLRDWLEALRAARDGVQIPAAGRGAGAAAPNTGAPPQGAA